MALRDNPDAHRRPGRECLARNLDDPRAHAPARPDRPEPDVEQRAAEEPGATFPTRARVLPDGTCPAVIGGVAVYRDVQHIPGRRTRALAPFLAPVLEQQLR